MAKQNKSGKGSSNGTQPAKGVGLDARQSENYAGDAALEKKLKEVGEDYFGRFQSDREDIDDKNQVSDYMYSAAQNRSLLSSEKTKGMDRDSDTRANVGSIIFHRQVNTMAAQMVGIVRSRQDLVKLEPVVNTAVEGSYEDALDRAKQGMALLRWTDKKDEWHKKLPEFAISQYKYSNIFAIIEQKRTFKTKLHVEATTEDVPDPTTGEVKTEITGETKSWESNVVDNFPSIRFPHVGSIYMDRWIKDVESQNCIFILTLRNRTEVYNDVMMGYFDEKAYEKLDDGYFWDGTYGGKVKENEEANRETTFSPSGTDMFLQWDMLIRAPMDNGKWDDDNPPEIHWVTLIGNSVGSSEVMRIEKNPDPDDEFPLKELRIMPDNSDTLYHTTVAEIVRSMYSADCTLLNQALDNMGNRNDPPLQVLDGEHRVKDFTFKKGAIWNVYQKDAITPVMIPDTTQNTSILRDQIQSEIKQALATDPAMMGQYAGARTPATEFLGVNQNTNKIHYMQITYVLNQLLPWMARKRLSYWQAFGLPTQVVQITDDDKAYLIKPKDVSGEYDIVVDIVDEYQDDMVRQQAEREIFQLLSSVPELRQSSTHRVDMGELFKEFLIHRKYPASRIVLPFSGRDAEELARTRINTMLYSGVYIRPGEGEDYAIQLRTAKAERLRWRGMEDSQDTRAINLPLLDQYVAELEALVLQSASGGGAGGQQGAPPEQGTQNQTPGEVVGNEQAGVLGAAMGGF